MCLTQITVCEKTQQILGDVQSNKDNHDMVIYGTWLKFPSSVSPRSIFFVINEDCYRKP